MRSTRTSACVTPPALELLLLLLLLGVDASLDCEAGCSTRWKPVCREHTGRAGEHMGLQLDPPTHAPPGRWRFARNLAWDYPVFRFRVNASNYYLDLLTLFEPFIIVITV